MVRDGGGGDGGGGGSHGELPRDVTSLINKADDQNTQKIGVGFPLTIIII